MALDIIKINDYLKFVIKEDHKGKRYKCVFNGIVIGTKKDCGHEQCLIKFIAESTLVAEQMERFGKALEPSENLN